ncbi:MAG: DUF192 domain-containing protein [Nanoarchaeota archaeon]|nr:DUF192 domain-containing protein [Nanoarchaeota archaeon]
MGKIKIKFGKKTSYLPIKRTSFFGKAFGLMFKSRNTDSLLFDFREDTNARIHSIFVFFPFLAIWLDDKNNVKEWSVISPFRFHISSPESFRKIVEVPLNSKNRQIVEFFVGSRKV